MTVITLFEDNAFKAYYTIDNTFTFSYSIYLEKSNRRNKRLYHMSHLTWPQPRPIRDLSVKVAEGRELATNR